MNKRTWWGIFLVSLGVQCQAAWACSLIGTSTPADVPAMALATSASPGQIVPELRPTSSLDALLMLPEEEQPRRRHPLETPWNGVDLVDLAVQLGDVFSPVECGRVSTLISDGFIRQTGVALSDFWKK